MWTGHVGKRYITPIFQEKMTELYLSLTVLQAASSHFCLLCFSQSVLSITLLLSVLVSLQPGAFSILLWQWNSDDEPCLQGAIPKGQPHTNKYTRLKCTSMHASSTHKTNMHAVRGSLLSCWITFTLKPFEWIQDFWCFLWSADETLSAMCVLND